MLQRRCSFAFYGLLMAVFVGCGGGPPKLYPVTGTVTYEDEPVEGASVVFIPQGGKPSFATTDAAGKYALSTGGQPGAPLGTYSVTISKMSGAGSDPTAGLATPQAPGVEPSEEEKRKIMEQERKAQQEKIAKMQGGGAKQTNLLPIKFASPEGSGLHGTVTGDVSKDVIDFPLKP